MTIEARLPCGCKTPAAALLMAAMLVACGSSIESQAVQADGASSFSSSISGPSALPSACQDRHSEGFPQLVAHPVNGEQISAVYLQDGTRAVVGAASRDGGRTWQRAPISAATACAGGPPEREGAFNPLLAQGYDGRVYYGYSFGFTVAFAADDAAGSWNEGVSPGDYDDSENLNLLADPVAPAKVYALWTHFTVLPVLGLPLASELRTAISADGARSFGAPRVVAASPPGRIIINGRLRRASDSALLACYDSVSLLDLPNAITLARTDFLVHCVRSTDGENWSAPVAAGPHVFLPLTDPEGRSTPGADPAFVSGSAKFDLATGPAGVALIVHADRDADGSGRLRLARSDDDGRSWSAPRDVITRSAAVFQPAVAIGADGGIGLFWYDWTSDQPGDGPLSTDAWFAGSRDGGATWTLRHLAGPFDLRAAHQDGLTYDGGALGAYQDLVALPGGFGAAFTVGPPLAQDGGTDVIFVRLAEP